MGPPREHSKQLAKSVPNDVITDEHTDDHIKRSDAKKEALLSFKEKR